MREYNVYIFTIFAPTYCYANIIFLNCFRLTSVIIPFLTSHKKNIEFYFWFIITASVSCIQNIQWKY